MHFFLFFATAVPSFALLENLFGHHGFHSNPDIVCVMEHCATQSAACAEDSNCRANMECVIKCGFTNTTCALQCMNTYEDDTYDALMQCLVDNYHCLQLVPPDPSFRCSPPETSVKNFTLAQLQGSWYVALGLNPEYDCFDCQISVYSPTPNSKNYTLKETYDTTMLNGTTRHRSDIQQVAQRDIFNGGNLDYTNSMMGLTMYAKWQVIDYAETGNYVIMYYCGQLASNYWYEGGVVYSRTQIVGKNDMTKIAEVVETKMGQQLQQFCRPRTLNC